MGFQHMTKEQLKKASDRGRLSQKSQSLKLAWEREKELKYEYENGGSPKEIANKYKINIRSFYRIVRGK